MSTATELVLTGALTEKDLTPLITAPLPPAPTTLPLLRSRLDAAGRLTLRDATLVLGRSDQEDSEAFLIGVNSLSLINSTVVTNGNSLTIVCASMSMDSASVVISFPESSRRAPDSSLGDDGGDLDLFVLDQAPTGLKVILHGQHGADGLAGKPGERGAQGPRGRSARNGLLGTCRRGPGRGGRGGRGANGENGQDGTDGGDGGVMRVRFVELPIPSSFSPNFSAEPGIGGKGGNGGVGGAGGAGGLGGKNAGNCLRSDPVRNSGPEGPKGADGLVGADGVSGMAGKLVMSRILVSEVGA